MSHAEDLLRDLNPPQREAASLTDGPLLVLAGAGSGKTRVITHRIAYLLRSGVPAEAVLAITFTNKAAREMKDRAERLCGVRTPWISTFHSLAARVLRRHIYRIEPYDTSFTICDRDDCKALVRAILKALDIDSRLWEPSGLLAEISRIKGGREPPEFGSDYRYGQVLRDVFRLYGEHLASNNLLDFDDLLLLLVRLFEEHPDVLSRYRAQFRYVLIDEYQDTNAVQYRISRLLTEEHGNLCITGDPDQSIYHWRGADITNILEFERDYPGARSIKLEQNYRSTKNVLRVANALISRNEQRKPKELWTENPDGDPVRVYRFEHELEEARDVARLLQSFMDAGVSCGDMAVFYRLNSLSRAVEQELIYGNVPYTIVGGLEFFLRREIKDMLAFLRILDNPRDSESLKRVINVPARGIGASTLDKLIEAARSARRGLLEVVLDPSLREGVLPKRQAGAVNAFRSIYERLAALKDEPVADVLTAIIQQTGYGEFLDKQFGDEARDRHENLEELVNAAVEHDRTHEPGSLTEFLELAAILGDVDRWEQREDRVSLMTLHSAKGLEFPVVVIIGVEDGILPLIRSGDEEPDFEEERRLLYVGITRAREKLYLTHTVTRMRFGQSHLAAPSRFLGELLPMGADAHETFAQLEVDIETEQSLHRKERARRQWDLGDDARDDGFDHYCKDESSHADDDAWGADAIGDGVELDEDPFPPGARVRHEDYGDGEVLRSSGLGARRRVTVRFDEAGEKQFVVSYAPLRLLT